MTTPRNFVRVGPRENRQPATYSDNLRTIYYKRSVPTRINLGSFLFDFSPSTTTTGPTVVISCRHRRRRFRFSNETSRRSRTAENRFIASATERTWTHPLLPLPTAATRVCTRTCTRERRNLETMFSLYFLGFFFFFSHFFRLFLLLPGVIYSAPGDRCVRKRKPCATPARRLFSHRNNTDSFSERSVILI